VKPPAHQLHVFTVPLERVRRPGDADARPAWHREIARVDPVAPEQVLDERLARPFRGDRRK